MVLVPRRGIQGSCVWSLCAVPHRVVVEKDQKRVQIFSLCLFSFSYTKSVGWNWPKMFKSVKMLSGQYEISAAACISDNLSTLKYHHVQCSVTYIEAVWHFALYRFSVARKTLPAFTSLKSSLRGVGLKLNFLWRLQTQFFSAASIKM